MSILEWVSAACLVAGAGFGVVGGIGVLRFPDFFTRLHAASVTDTLCAGLILIGLMLQSDGILPVIKLFLIFFFLLFTTPTATHALAKAALHGGHQPLLNKGGAKSSNSSSS